MKIWVGVNKVVQANFISRFPVAVILSIEWKINFGSLLIIHARSSIALVTLVDCNLVILQCWSESVFELFLKKTKVKVSYTTRCSLLNLLVFIRFCSQNFSTSSKFVSGIFADTFTAETLMFSIFQKRDLSSLRFYQILTYIWNMNFLFIATRK